MKTITTCRELIETFGDQSFGPAVYGDTRDPFRASRNAKLRGTIAVARWEKAIEACASRDIELTREQLAQWHAAYLKRAHREAKRKKRRHPKHRPPHRARKQRHR